MVRGTEDIIRWFDLSEQNYWRIYPHKGIGNGNPVMQSKQLEEQSHGDALEDLKHKIRSLHRGTFTIAAYNTPDRLPTKGYFYTEIEITHSEPQQAQIAGPVGISPEDVQKLVNDGINKYKTEQELDRLKAENADLKKENKVLKGTADEPLNKFLGALAPYAPQIMGNMFGGQPGVAGMPSPDPGPTDNHIQEVEVVQTDLTPEQSEVISGFVSALAEADPDYLNTLRRLTKAIVEKPDMITMVKNFI